MLYSMSYNVLYCWWILQYNIENKKTNHVLNGNQYSFKYEYEICSKLSIKKLKIQTNGNKKIKL